MPATGWRKGANGTWLAPPTAAERSPLAGTAAARVATPVRMRLRAKSTPKYAEAQSSQADTLVSEPMEPKLPNAAQCVARP